MHTDQYIGLLVSKQVWIEFLEIVWRWRMYAEEYSEFVVIVIDFYSPVAAGADVVDSWRDLFPDRK